MATDIIQHVKSVKSTMFVVTGQSKGKTLLPLPVGNEDVSEVDPERYIMYMFSQVKFQIELSQLQIKRKLVRIELKKFFTLMYDIHVYNMHFVYPVFSQIHYAVFHVCMSTPKIISHQKPILDFLFSYFSFLGCGISNHQNRRERQILNFSAAVTYKCHTRSCFLAQRSLIET